MLHVLLLWLPWGVACGDKGDDSGDSGVAAAEVPFTVVQQTLTQSCAFSSCHGAGSGGLTLGDGGEYAALVNVASVAAPDAILVIPGDADQSYLIQKMEGAAGIVGDPMPPSGTLDPAIIADIRAWIARGAPND